MQHGQAASCWSNDEVLFPRRVVHTVHAPRLKQEPVARVSSVAVVLLLGRAPELRVCQ